MYITLLTILLTYCSKYFNVVHIAHIARVLINCTYCRYCRKLLDIVQNCSILLVATRVVINCTYCQYCWKLLKIVQYMPVFLCPFWAKCRLLLLRCLLLQWMLLQCCKYQWLSYYSMNSQQPFIYWAPQRPAPLRRGPATAPRAGPLAGSLALGSSSGSPPAEARLRSTSRLQPRVLHTGNLAYQISSASNSLRRKMSALPALKGLRPVEV